MPGFNISCKIDTRNLEAGIMAGRKYSRRSLPQTINSALLHVAWDAQQRTPFVTPQVIDSELSVVVAPTIGKRGKPLKGKSTYSVSSRVGYTGKNSDYTGKEAPLAVFIIQRMAREGKSLGKKMPLSKGMFKGIPRAQAAQMMARFVDQLIKNRHRSTHFLAAGWREAIDALKAVVSSGLRGQRGIGGQGLGSASPAVDGDTPVGMIENNVGLEGENADKANAALLRHAGPALQVAVDHEGKTRLELALKKMEAELAAVMKPFWG